MNDDDNTENTTTESAVEMELISPESIIEIVHLLSGSSSAAVHASRVALAEQVLRDSARRYGVTLTDTAARRMAEDLTALPSPLAVRDITEGR